MCGIAGIISKTQGFPVKQKIHAMSRAIKHRGPDGEGFTFFKDEHITSVYSDETPASNINNSHYLFNASVSFDEVSISQNTAFAHRRLSIIDLSESGHQPMCDTSGDYWITFNGEVYNYIELREELKQKGHQFITKTDTEVVVAAYKEWGMKCLERFNGMWAFAIYDKVKRIIFCARDRAGVKPFYYINTNDVFAFASEQKAFIKSGLLQFEVNEKEQYDFILNAAQETNNQSLFQDIYELKPSTSLLFDLHRKDIVINQYYQIETKINVISNEDEIINLIEEKLLNSIKLRLRSDVEVGSCLSGGLDSSVIAGMIYNIQPQASLKLFTSVFPNEKFDESVYAREVAGFVKGKWFHTTPTAEGFFNELSALNYYQDLPIWTTSTYSQYKVMQLAKEQHVKVVLDGQGADELFAGYAHHYYSYWKETLGLGTYQKIKSSEPTIHHPFQLFFKQQIKEWFHIKRRYSSFFNPNAPYHQVHKTTHFSNHLNEQLKIDYQGRLKSFLKCEDRCSMAFGIESRVPFSDDVDLVDLAFSVDGRLKIKNGVSKYLLREASKNYIPKSIYQRKDKIGFEAPLNKWLILNQKLVMDVIISDLDFLNRDLITKKMSYLIQKHPNFIFRLFSFAIWKRNFTHTLTI